MAAKQLRHDHYSSASFPPEVLVDRLERSRKSRGQRPGGRSVNHHVKGCFSGTEVRAYKSQDATCRVLGGDGRSNEVALVSQPHGDVTLIGDDGQRSGMRMCPTALRLPARGVHSTLVNITKRTGPPGVEFAAFPSPEVSSDDVLPAI